MGHFGFSYIGLIYMLILQVPNIMWASNKPEGYDPSGENKVLLLFERIGQVLCTATILFFSDTNPHGWNVWIFWICLSIVLMMLYILFWIRYFSRGETLYDFYRPLFGFLAPGASLSVLAFLILGIYGRLIWLIIASLILGIGHIGIHFQHIQKLRKNNFKL